MCSVIILVMKKTESSLLRMSTEESLPTDHSEEDNQTPSSSLQAGTGANCRGREFEENGVQGVERRGKKALPRPFSFATINQLEQEKQELIESIDILRSSAVSALAEKEGQIQKLRQNSLNYQEGCFELYQEFCSQQEISDHYEELECRYKDERRRLKDHLRQKQATIADLLGLIQQLKASVSEFQSRDQERLTDIEHLESEIEQLNVKIDEFALRMAVDEITSDFQDKSALMESVSSHKELGLTSCNKGLWSEENSFYHYQRVNDQLQTHHRQELTQLTEFYEQKFNLLRQYNATTPREQSASNIQDFELGLEYLEGDSEPAVERSLAHSYSQEERKRFMSSYQIENQERSEPSVHNLQEEITSPVQFRDSLSQCTQPHFGNRSGFGKQKSSATFEEPSKLHCIKIEDKGAREELLEKDIQIQIDASQGRSTDLMWGKAKGFATGLITGVSLTSLISLALRKKR